MDRVCSKNYIICNDLSDIKNSFFYEEFILFCCLMELCSDYIDLLC